ncbi:MAG: GGDEF domain-containing phosphodiesterase [Eubacteriales bacterium]
MKSKKYWNILFQPHKYPCILADAQTEEVVYYNDEMGELVGNDVEIIGMKFYDVIPNHTSSLGNNPRLDWAYRDIFESKIFNNVLNRVIATTYTLVEYQGECFIFATYKPIQTTKHFHYTFEEMMSRCIGITQSTKKNPVPALLEILGEFYDADKTAFYRIDIPSKTAPLIAGWTKAGLEPVVGELSDKVDLTHMGQWIHARNEIGVIEVSECIASVCPEFPSREVLQALALENAAICVIDNAEHVPFAMVVMSNRKNLAADFRLLQAVARFAETDVSTSEMKTRMTQIRTLDMLTGFYNRDSYSKKMGELQVYPSHALGVIVANVNGLKKVNTKYGLAKGDSYIKKAAEQIKEYFQVDFYRIAGDEFVGFFPDVEKDAFEQKVDEMQRHMHEDGNSIVAYGHAWTSGRYDLSALIHEAEAIMYINKQEYYHNAPKELDEFSDSTLADLLSYLQNDEFMIYLQPQVHLVDGSLYGAEALIRRYDKKNEKMVFPDQFIPLYEEKSIIRHVDIFVVEKVCQLLQSCKQEGKLMPISVNLSRVTLQEYGIAHTIAQICDQYEIPHKYLVIEVTERVGLVENNVASSLIHDFQSRGFHISLDDFGCAYSNIITLAQIEVDEIKIDKSLVDHLITNEKNRILVKNVLRMCNELEGTATLAEGIEEEEQASTLYELGCQLGQGYYYSKPIPAERFCQIYMS